MATALRKALRRAQKALFHEDLLALIETIQQISTPFDLDKCSFAVHPVAMRVTELQRMIRRAHGHLVKDTSTSDEDALKPGHIMTSTYPQDIQLPGDRHDNDRRDITEISIVPTIGELRSDALNSFLHLASINHTFWMGSNDPSTFIFDFFGMIYSER